MGVSFEASETFYFEFRALPCKFRETIAKFRALTPTLAFTPALSLCTGVTPPPDSPSALSRNRLSRPRHFPLTPLTAKRVSRPHTRGGSSGPLHERLNFRSPPMCDGRDFREISRAARSPQIARRNLRNSRLGLDAFFLCTKLRRPPPTRPVPLSL